MEKTLKPSARGLTFSLRECDSDFKVGDKFRYTIDGNEILITKDNESGTNTVSKKISREIKSLFDLRTKEIRKVISNARHISVQIFDNKIFCTVIQKIASTNILRCRKVSVERLLETKIEVLSIDRTLLEAVSGQDYVQISFFDEDYIKENTEKSSESYEQMHKSSVQHLFNVVSLFSGCGMLDYPFSKDGQFKIVFANDINDAQCESYTKNIGKVIIKEDIRKINVPRADVVLGGMSCKPFSNCNRQLTRLRNHPDYFLIKEYIRCVRQADPKVFAIENVPEFVTTAEGAILENLLCEFNDYKFTVKKVRDCELGGYTTRDRVIIIASRIGEVVIPDLKVSSFKTVKDALDKVDASWYNFNDVSSSRADTQLRMSFVQNGHYWRDIPDKLRRKWKFANFMKRLALDEPAPTIVNVRKSLIMPPKEYLVNGKERTLSVAECSALMGFDKNFRYYGSLDEKQQQVANGVPYMIALAVKNAIKTALNNYRKAAVI